MRGRTCVAALGLASALVLGGCGILGAPSGQAIPAQDITFWLIKGDTPASLRSYLIDQYGRVNGGTLTIKEQSRDDILDKLAAMLPDEAGTPDVTEIGNVWSSTLTNAGALADISDMYTALGGDKLVQSFVEAGKVDGKNYALPYYFSSRYMFYRKDVWAAAGVAAPPRTLADFNQAVATITEKNPDSIADFSGFLIGGQDWRNEVSWIFANGGELATKDTDGKWTSTLSSPGAIEGLAQLQEIQQKASMAPSTVKDQSPWLYINDTDSLIDDSGIVTGSTSLAAATIMAPGWARWSIGGLTKDPVTKKDIRTWDDEIFGVFPLPGNDGKPAPVFVDGSTVGISAASRNQAGARQLLEIIFSPEYQIMLGQNGLGPANSDYMSSLGTDEFARALIDSASNSRLTPAAPGWARVEASGKLEEFFQKVADGGDIISLAKEYDDLITPMLNR